jgi:phosphoribosylformimino-5-aminoimidazole carboxamide ribotide isomerase
MTIYPAIDIMEGKAVRLKQGRKAEATVYGDPLEIAGRWVTKGAEWLHVVDLDGAFSGRLEHLDLLRQMAAVVPHAKIQVGGGIRSMTAVDSLLSAGIQRVVFGTAAVQNPEFVKQALREQPDRVAIGIDAHEGKVRVSGWTEDSHITAIALARKLRDSGARLVIYTDISRDGILEGHNVEATKEMLEETDMSVIASGGVSDIDDVRRLAELDHSRLNGVIIGKALYEGLIHIEEALAIAG